MAEKEAAGVLGLAQKAGRIASGDAAVRTALENGKRCCSSLRQTRPPIRRKNWSIWQKERTFPLSARLRGQTWAPASERRPARLPQ